MNRFQKNCAIVIDCLRERNYSEASIHAYELIFSKMDSYLNSKGVIYSPELGEEMLFHNEDSFFVVKGTPIRSACIHKLNDVYLHGRIQTAQMSPRKKYNQIELVPQFENAVIEFMASKETVFTSAQQANVNRRIRLFFKCIQSWGINKLDEISYETLYAYHNELSHLKTASRTVEESSIHQLLHFLADKDEVAPGRYLYIYLLEKGHIVSADAMTADERLNVEKYRLESLEFPASRFLLYGKTLIAKYREAGYVEEMCTAVERVILYLYLFLDLNSFGYLPELADIWLNSEAAKEAITGSNWKLARRVLHVFRDMISNGEPVFGKVYRKGISGLDNLPDWCKTPLMDFAYLRAKEKLEDTTVKNDIYSILRLMRFILQLGRQSFAELTSDDIVEFNLKDIHGSPEGKNACNARIRRFLKYLDYKGFTSSNNLYLALSTTSATVETIVKTFTDDEIRAIREYTSNARTPIEIRDSAMILLGCDMGMRGCDIARLKFTDIDWRNQSIRFMQDKTDAEVILAMPTAVGNAIFRYIRNVRNPKADSDYVFVSISAPFSPITRNVCYGALRRILPNRNVTGSGFHAARKTFATNRLKNGIDPSMIADALGHASTTTLVPYLSLDGERMSLCPLSFEDLAIPMEGGFV